MAEIQESAVRSKHHGIRGKKLSTRIDLTPMVDLGFLLITFFIFTTTLSQPKAMRLNLQQDGPYMPIPESKTLNLVLATDNRVYYYHGRDLNTGAFVDYSSNGLRAIIQNKLAEVAKRWGNSNGTVVLIKPTSGASYRDIVAVLDEMQINLVKTFMLVDASPKELELAAK